jgi:thioesterase domain-containing protein
MAQQLRSAGEDVAILILLDEMDPENRRRPRKSKVTDRYRSRATRYGRASPREMPSMIRASIRYRSERALSHLPYRARRIPSSRTERLQRLKVWQQRMAPKYRPVPYHGSAAIVRTEVGEQFDVGGRSSWRQRLTGPVDVLSVEGSHTELLEYPAVRKVAGYLNEVIARSLDSHRE